MNLLQIYIESLPIEVAMNFGINKPIVLNYIDIEDRLTRKGDPHVKNFFMEFLKLNEDGEPFQREEFSFFKFRSDKLNFLNDNFIDQFNKLHELAKVIYEDNDKMYERITEVYNMSLFTESKYATLYEQLDAIMANESKTIVKEDKMSRDEIVENVEDLNYKLNFFWKEVLRDKLGVDSTRLQLITVVDKKGYKNLPSEVKFVAGINDKLKFDSKYLRIKAKSENPVKVDKVGAGISEADIGNLDVIIDDDITAIEDEDIVLD